MMKHRRNVLLLIAGVALSIALAYWFDLHKYFLAWFWSVEDTVRILGIRWLVRRLERFITTPLMRWGIIAVVGYDRWGDYRRTLQRPFIVFHARVLALWPVLSISYRILSVASAAALIGVIVWTTVEIPYLIMLPVATWLIGKIYWWIVDQLFDRTLYMMRWHAFKNRIRHHRLMRKAIGPWLLVRRKIEPKLESWRERRKARREQQNNDESS